MGMTSQIYHSFLDEKTKVERSDISIHDQIAAQSMLCVNQCGIYETMRHYFIFSEEKADIELMKPEQFASLERIKQSIRKDQEQVRGHP